MSTRRSQAFSSRPRLLASASVFAVVGLAIVIECRPFTFSPHQGSAYERAARVAPTLAAPLMPLSSTPEPLEPHAPLSHPPGMPPTWKPGYEWHYRWNDPRSSGTYIRSVVGEEWIDGVPYYVMRSGNRCIYWGKNDLTWVMEQVNGVIESQAVPAYQKFAWPLQPGKKWESRYHWTHPAAKKTEERARRHRVTGIETVEVPAGSFQAYRIIAMDSTGKTVNEYWYAPEIRWLVKERLFLAHGVRERALIYASLWPKSAAR